MVGKEDIMGEETITLRRDEVEEVVANLDRKLWKLAAKLSAMKTNYDMDIMYSTARGVHDWLKAALVAEQQQCKR